MITPRRSAMLPEGTTVTSWTDSVNVHWPYVDIAGTTVFTDGTRVTGETRLRYRDLIEIDEALTEAGLTITDVRDAPDRPGLEWVVIARRDETRRASRSPDRRQARPAAG